MTVVESVALAVMGALLIDAMLVWLMLLTGRALMIVCLPLLLAAGMM